MNESITPTTKHFSPAASLAAIGVKLSHLDLFGPIRTQVQIRQKTVKHTPTDKLYDAFISLLAGAHVLATCYEEVVVDRLFAGNVQLIKALQPLVEAAETTLQLDAAKRARTIIRVDAGAGTLDDLNWLLARGYEIIAKEYSGQRVLRLAKTVVEWIQDPAWSERSFGWVTEPPPGYVRPVRRIAVRCRRQDGTFAYGVLICSLSAEQVLMLLGHPKSQAADPVAVLLAYVTFYDLRGGGIETSLKGDKQGLGLTKRNKKRKSVV